VSLNSIANDGPDPNAAFAVNGFNLEFGTGDPRVAQVRVRANLAVRGTGAYLLRIGYLITLLGRVSQLPG
jgi:hypothetical protein